MTLPTTLAKYLHRGQHGAVVRQIQELLNLAGSRPQLPPTGFFGDLTDQSVRYFQSRHGLIVDGIVGRQTFASLDRVVRSRTAFQPAFIPTAPAGSQTGEADVSGAASGGGFSFPLQFRPSPDWRSGMRSFGSARDHGNRLHAACDLWAPVGTIIYAVADGVLVRDPYPFYQQTYAVEIRHGTFVVRYGEIMPHSYVGGRTVRKGQPIAKVGLLTNGMHMLHFEMYSNGASTAPLKSHGPYRRRSDLINPTPYLNDWSQHLPRGG